MLRATRLTPVVPEAASSYLLPTLVGHQRAAEIFYTADWIDAPRAVELGIASRMLAADELLPAVRELAARFAAQPLGSLRHTKRLLLAVRSQGIREARAREDAAFAVRVGSPENVEAIQAFFEKRPADFSAVPDLKLARDGTVAADPETCATSVPGLYAGGDCAHGGKEVVDAVQAGKIAAASIHQMISGQAAPDTTRKQDDQKLPA